MNKLAVQLFMLREMAKKDIAGALKAVADIGYTGVEFAGLYGNKPSEIRKILDDLGLKACSTHAQLLLGKTTLEAEVEAAKTLGYELVVIPNAPAEKFLNRAGVQEIANGLKALVEKLKPYGLRLGYHNHAHEMVLIDGKYALEILYELTPNVEGQFNLYWGSDFGKVDVPAFIKRNGRRITSYQIQDGPLARGGVQTPVGEGKLDVRACLAATAPGVDRWIVIENDAVNCDPVDAARRSFRFMTSNGLAKGR